jgi:hypothetical protein
MQPLGRDEELPPILRRLGIEVRAWERVMPI